MDVRSQPDVERQIPTDVVRIFIDYDAVAVPIPVVAVLILEWGCCEVVAVKPETVRTAASQHPDMPGAKSADEASMLPRMIHVETAIVATPVVANPAAIGVNVRRVRVVVPVTKMMVVRVMPVPVTIVVPVAVRTMFRNIFVMIAITIMVVITVLSQTVDRYQRQYCQQSQ